MTKNVVSFDYEDSIISICDAFISNNFRRVPILADGKLVGIISRKDMITRILRLRSKDRKARTKPFKIKC